MQQTANTSSSPPAPATAASDVRIGERYLELLKGCLTRDLFPDVHWADVATWEPNRYIADPGSVRPMLADWGMRLVSAAEAMSTGTIASGETMVGRHRLDNVQYIVRSVIDDGVPGDLVETGVWRGGVIALMRAALDVYDPGGTRRVWACDSFEGLPADAGVRYELDRDLTITFDAPPSDDRFDSRLAVSLEDVQENLARYGLLDERVRFVVGRFGETLGRAPIGSIAVLRLDGDLYESTMDALVHLEPRVAPGGFVIIDDYGALDVCRQATDDYRARTGITAPITPVDHTGVWWRKD